MSATIDGSPNTKTTIIQEFIQWLDKKRQKAHPYPLQHNWSKRATRKRFAQAKDVDRYFQNKYDTYSTVMVTRTADRNTKPLLEQTEDLNPNSYKAERRRLLKRLDVWDDYAAVVVLAPKYDLPNPNPTDVRTHVHEFYWIPGKVSPNDFYPLILKHLKKVEGATAEQHTTDDNRMTCASITVRQHSTETYPTFSQQSAIDARRGPTTSLPYEILSNLPLRDAERDAKDLHDDRCLKWCATMSAGRDGSHDTRGISVWQPLGRFREYADKIEETYWRKAERDYHREMRRLDYPILTQHSPKPHSTLIESKPTLDESLPTNLPNL